MTAFRVFLTRIAAVGVCFALLAGGAANAQINGQVIEINLSPLSNAHVELWDSYPDGNKLHAVLTGPDGSFSFSGLSESSYDVRVWKGDVPTDMYYPSVLFDVPQPFAGLLFVGLVAVPPVPGLSGGPVNPCDFSDTSFKSTYLGYPIRPGDVVGVLDPDDIWCGMLAAPADDSYLVHVYGDIGSSGEDEGALDGDTLTFRINNKPAEPIDTVGIWQSGGSFYMPLGGTSFDIEAVNVTPPPDKTISPSDIIDLEFQIKNTGNHADTYDLYAVSLSGWSVSLPGGAASGTLNPGESETITVTVTVPVNIAADAVDYTYLFATSQSNLTAMGVDRGKMSAQGTDVFEEDGTVPERYFLAQNYPNPFNPSTMIAFGLQAGGHTTIMVYNLLGQNVALLLDDYQPAGGHTVMWDGKGFDGRTVPTGIYFYRIRSGEFEQTRKMVLMK